MGGSVELRLAIIIICLLVGGIGTCVPALSYSIDASDDDWVSGWVNKNIDGDEPDIPAKYDICVSLSNKQDDTWYLYYRTMGYYPPGNVGDFSEIYIDSDIDAGTGGPAPGVVVGFNYRLKWDLGSPDADTALGNAMLYVWDDVSREYISTGGSYQVARGLASNTGPIGNEMFVEWSVPGSAIGNPSNFLWGAYLYDSSLDRGDACPKYFSQEAVPEPSTLLLVLPALAFLGKVRGRSRRAKAG